MVNVIKVAAVQHYSQPGKREENLKNASEGLFIAKRRGAQLAVLPELFSIGYGANSSIFQLGETPHGPTITWLQEAAKRHSMYIGGGAAVYDEGHLYNRYYLVNPHGEICGFAQKDRAESYCFQRNRGIHIIPTDQGNIAVLICADGHFVSILEELKKHSFDLLLLPHGWPTPKRFRDESLLTAMLARYFGVPAVYVNGLGQIAPMEGLLGKLLKPSEFALRGRSEICDCRGETLQRSESMPDVLISEIETGRIPSEKSLPDYDGWVLPGNSFLRRMIIPWDIIRGKKKYSRRVRKAAPNL